MHDTCVGVNHGTLESAVNDFLETTQKCNK